MTNMILGLLVYSRGSLRRWAAEHIVFNRKAPYAGLIRHWNHIWLLNCLLIKAGSKTTWVLFNFRPVWGKNRTSCSDLCKDFNKQPLLVPSIFFFRFNCSTFLRENRDGGWTSCPVLLKEDNTGDIVVTAHIVRDCVWKRRFVYVWKTEKEYRGCVRVLCVLHWQLVFSVINDVLCDLISASEDQRLFQLDLVKVATPRRPLIIISIINPHYHRGMRIGCVMSWSHACWRTSTRRNLITYQNTMTDSLTHSFTHTHTHTHPSLQVDLNHNRSCRNGLSVQIKSLFLRIKQHWWWWHFRSSLQTQMSKHHSVTTTSPCFTRSHVWAHIHA